jgi:hypothetical protein
MVSKTMTGGSNPSAPAKFKSSISPTGRRHFPQKDGSFGSNPKWSTIKGVFMKILGLCTDEEALKIINESKNKKLTGEDFKLFLEETDYVL